MDRKDLHIGDIAKGITTGTVYVVVGVSENTGNLQCMCVEPGNHRFWNPSPFEISFEDPRMLTKIDKDKTV